MGLENVAAVSARQVVLPVISQDYTHRAVDYWSSKSHHMYIFPAVSIWTM